MVAIDAFTDELIDGKETVAATVSQIDNSIRIILQKKINLIVYPLLIFLDLTAILASSQNLF